MARNPTERFSDRVAAYERSRPDYPAALFQWLGKAAAIADLGSGTGIFTAHLLALAPRVYAVEPNGPMREAAERTLGGDAAFASVAGTAEATTLPPASVDLVTAAQAFHWFAAEPTRREIARILRPAGRVALVWNERRLTGTRFLEGYEALVKRFGTDYKDLAHQATLQAGKVREVLERVDVKTFANEQRLDLEGLTARLLSSSYIPQPGDPRAEGLLEAIRALFDGTSEGGIVRLVYDTVAYVGPVRR